MTRHFQCRDVVQAHIIRSLLLEHEIETEVIHQNASTLWAGGIAACILAVRDEDMDLAYKALHAPRAVVTDESVAEDVAFQEHHSGPLKFGWDFFLGCTFIGISFAWCVWVLGLVSLALQLYPKPLRIFDSSVSYHRPIELTDFAIVTMWGAVGGVLCALAFLAARWSRPDANGRRPTAAYSAFTLLFFPYIPPLLIAWFVFYMSARKRNKP